MQLFFESPTAKVFYDPELDTLFLEYTSKVKNHDEFVDINSEVLSAFRKLNTNTFVADIRHMGVISLDCQQWVVNRLIPGLFEHLKGGMLYHAQFLDPSEIFSKVSGKNIQKKTKDDSSGFVVEQFSSREELEKWIREVPA